MQICLKNMHLKQFQHCMSHVDVPASAFADRRRGDVSLPHGGSELCADSARHSEGTPWLGGLLHIIFATNCGVLQSRPMMKDLSTHHFFALLILYNYT